MTDQQPPDWVQAWQVALGCEVFGPPGLWMYRPVQPGPVRLIPNRDSAEYAWSLVTAADYVSITKGNYGGGNKYAVSWKKGMAWTEKGPDPVSALIAAVLASKGETT